MYSKYNNILKNLTIVIPSYNRQSYLIRTIKYWSDKKVKIIILDGSKNSLKKKIKITSKNITYIHNPVGLYSRLLSSSKKVKTKYVMLGCDDEFYIPSALEKCLRYLSLKKDYGCCTGRALGFNYKDGKVYGYSQYSNLKKLDLKNSLIILALSSGLISLLLNSTGSHPLGITVISFLSSL